MDFARNAAAANVSSRSAYDVDRKAHQPGRTDSPFRMTTSDLTDARIGSRVHFESIARNGRDIIENAHLLIGP
jgi:hypothetical protein